MPVYAQALVMGLPTRAKYVEITSFERPRNHGFGCLFHRRSSLYFGESEMRSSSRDYDDATNGGTGSSYERRSNAERQTSNC